MGKAKGKKDESSKIPKCICDDPFTCMCGNRPPRPSKGHKWYPEDQIWGGKGHKQKGASGQVALVSKQAEVTEKGNTKVEQWQRLPSQLLQEICKRQKRPNPKFKNIEKKDRIFKFQVIVPDMKDDDKDLFFVSAQSVSNEEQAKEEGCLLALLHLTPSIPHERLLPEPYKTTWLNAVMKNKKSDSIPSEKIDVSHNIDAGDEKCKKITVGNSTSKFSPPIAQASTSLQSAKIYTSNASKRQHQDELRKERNARISRHEAVRMANQNHPVFMSAQIRQKIESLLRGDTNLNLIDSEIDSEDRNRVDDEDPVGVDDVSAYVEDRLHIEGFTKRQAKASYKEFIVKNANNPKYVNLNDNEELWDKVYEDCLQWLLVHLNEDQLPEGFDPRGRTLDVVVPLSLKSNKNVNGQSTDFTPTTDATPEHIKFASDYGISIMEAVLIGDMAKRNNAKVTDTIWSVMAQVVDFSVKELPLCSSEMRDDFIDELEALEAIYGSDCKVESYNGATSISLALEEGLLSLEIVIQNKYYPETHPSRSIVHGKWPKDKIGAFINIEMIKFIKNLPVGEPMIFSIQSFVQDLLHSDTVTEFPLLPYLRIDNQPNYVVEESTKRGQVPETSSANSTMLSERKVKLRPKERKKSFWNVLPKDTPPACANPSISNSLKKTRMSLPAASARKSFLDAMMKAETSGRVVLITGETGSGKSTQLPAYLLENDPINSKIVVAQPRRIAATGVATRVAEERGESRPGVDSVGYVVRGDSAICNNTRLVFCTTGVLLRQLQSEDALQCITHIVVDEVHERSLDSDILIGLLKQYLPLNPNLRLVLMSATMDTDRFTKYFGRITPHIHIPGRTFPVSDYTLEDVLAITGYIPPKTRRKNYQNVSSSVSRNVSASSFNDPHMVDEEDGQNTCAENEDISAAVSSHAIPIEDLLQRIDETVVDYDLITQLVNYIVSTKDPSDDGSILIFFAGVPEIMAAQETIRRSMKGLSLLLDIIPLHGSLLPKDQRKVFSRPERGYTKVILSTNVAETSVTIPDCTIVIDSAREKQSSYDPANRMPLLVEQFASKASLQQRRGRAGRVQSGTCYKLISKKTLLSLKDHSEPEIRRVALDQTLLQLLYLGVENGTGSFTNTLLDPPSQEAMDSALYSLLKLGAVVNKYNSGELMLSAFGNHLAVIPAPPIIGKMLVMGSILGCRSAALSMAAGMSVSRSPLVKIDNYKKRGNKTPENDIGTIEELKRQNILKERAAIFKAVGNSDHALLAFIFSKWKLSETGGGMRKRFCDSVGISFDAIREISQLVDQLDSALSTAGFPMTSASDCNTTSWRIVHACAVAAMAPSQLVKVQRPAAKYSETAEGAKLKDGEAKELKFFIRTDYAGGNVQNRANEERVFLHPSSINFANGNYNCPYLVYNSLVTTSKPFLRDVTECTAYALLLFGGTMEVQASKGLIVIDSWVNLAANARIGSLMGGLRDKVDNLLDRKIIDPSLDLSTATEMRLIVMLIKTDGLGS